MAPTMKVRLFISRTSNSNIVMRLFVVISLKYVSRNKSND